MAITVPGNPFGVDVAVGSAGGIGELHSAPQTVNGREQLQATLGQRVGEFGKAVEKWQAEIDQTRVQDASNQLNSAMLDLKYNKDTGWQTLQGKNALERPSGKSLLKRRRKASRRATTAFVRRSAIRVSARHSTSSTRA